MNISPILNYSQQKTPQRSMNKPSFGMHYNLEQGVHLKALGEFNKIAESFIKPGECPYPPNPQMVKIRTMGLEILDSFLSAMLKFNHNPINATKGKGSIFVKEISPVKNNATQALEGIVVKTGRNADKTTHEQKFIYGKEKEFSENLDTIQNFYLKE